MIMHNGDMNAVVMEQFNSPKNVNQPINFTVSQAQMNEQKAIEN